MNPALDALQPYPFEKLRRLFADVELPRERKRRRGPKPFEGTLFPEA